jgi:putative aldouronate transport system substrate-binding protein
MKRFVVIILTLCLTVTMLAGCGKKVETTETPKDGAKVDSKESSEETANSEPIVLKALVPNQGGLAWNDPEANPVYGWITEKTGYKVEYDILPADNPFDKLNAIVAAGADYDFIVLNDKSRYADYASQGALMDMKELIEQYAPSIASTISQSMFDVCVVGETYYCIPSASPTGREDSSNVGNGIMIRADILKKMGLTMPTTLEEFTAMLQAFKDTDPTGKGSAATPLSATMADLNNLRIGGLGGAFGVESDWKDVNGELVPYQLQDGFYDFLVYLNELYTKGLLDTEMPTNQIATTLEKFTTDLALCRIDGWWSLPSLVETFKTTNPEAAVEYVQPLEMAGKAGMSASSINQMDFYVVIPKNAKNVEATMDYFAKKLVPETFKEMVIGIEGVDHNVDAEGNFTPILPTFFEHRGNANIYLTGTTEDYGTYWLCRARKNEDQFKAYSQLNFDYGSFIHVNPGSDVPCSIYAQISTNLTNSASFTEEFVVNSVVSGITAESYQDFIAEWKSLGGDKLIEKYNEWYTSR